MRIFLLMLKEQQQNSIFHMPCVHQSRFNDRLTRSVDLKPVPTGGANIGFGCRAI